MQTAASSQLVHGYISFIYISETGETTALLNPTHAQSLHSFCSELPLNKESHISLKVTHSSVSDHCYSCRTRGPTIRLDNTADEPGVDGLTVPLSLYQLQNGVCYLTGTEVRFSKHAEFSILITALFL